MKVTTSIVSKILITAVAGWGFGVFISQPFKKDSTVPAENVKNLQLSYTLVQQNANWNKVNTVKNIESIPNCLYIYEDVTNNSKLRCKLPCISLYKGSKLLYRWEGNIMMRNNVTVEMIQQQIK
jgi:hypothetical protein